VGSKAPPKMDFMHIWGQKKAIWNTFFSINWFGHGVLEKQVQALSRTFRQRFKDLQGPCLFTRTFQALKIWKKIQGLSTTGKSPVFRHRLYVRRAVCIPPRYVRKHVAQTPAALLRRWSHRHSHATEMLMNSQMHVYKHMNERTNMTDCNTSQRRQ